MGPQEPPLEGVGRTALGMAVVRAMENRRRDRLFTDPYAQAFVDAAPAMFPQPTGTPPRTRAGGTEGAAAGMEAVDSREAVPRTEVGGSEEGMPWSAASLGGVLYAHAVMRTRFYDDYLTEAARACRQVVLLAAGLDTRAFRLAWPERTRVFELDLPEVLAFKDAVLAGKAAPRRHERTALPRCHERIALPVDLRDDWPAALLAAGFDRAARTAWLAEGLLIYLTAGESARLLAAVGTLSAPGSRLSFEHFPGGDSTLVSRAGDMPAMEPYTAMWKGGPGGDVAGRLARDGWRPRFHDLATLAGSYGRDLPGPATGGFLTAVRTLP
ncbi:SAM-dependent methyltransferase [Sphaerisporangium corydalis]|uniref:S-adenosyl-L-methionine-dependent methyltransferase n=1 Tax=Sphaerisporangium corydalis TaxID=1441875 RepID=A0ABV9ENI5_9ACTN|nr:SAM-dependent methyltransferase [Sphaerisporangium corydalis]